MNFHHGVIAVRDLEQSIRIFRDELGLNAVAGGRHGGRGTENAVIRFADAYIELLSVFDANKEIEVSGLRGRVLVEFIAKHGGGLLGYCLETDQMERQVAALRAAGLDIPDPLLVSRTTPSGQQLKWRVLLPGGVNWRRPWPFLIEPDAANGPETADAADHSLGATGIEGVAVAVQSAERGRELYGHFGLELAREDTDRELAAERARFAAGTVSIDVLAPSGTGPVKREIDAAGEGLFELVLRVESLDKARAWLARSGIALEPAPGHANGWLIPPDRAVGARLVLLT